MLSLLFIFLFLLIIAALALVIIHIIALWKIFEKAGEPGWAALVPIYNGFVLLKIVGMNPWWILIVFGANMLTQILSQIGRLSEFGFLILLPVSLLNMAISLYVIITTSINLSRSFGKDNSFAIGLILVSPIFYAMLGFGQEQYVGPNPVKDLFFKDPDYSSNDVRYCLGCGKRIFDETMKFCPHCGKSLKD